MIILNRVFSGRYLNNNLGHEVINFFQTDKGEHYIYITPYGVLKNAHDATDVVIMRHINNGYCEVLGWAVIEKCLLRKEFIKNAFKTKNKDKSIDEKERKNQLELIESNQITYNKKPLNKLFKNDDTIYITFKCKDFKRPKQAIYIIDNRDKRQEEENRKNHKDKICINFRIGEKLYNPITNNKEITKLKSFLNNSDFWDKKSFDKMEEVFKKVNKDITYLEVIGKEYDELAFSNWISYMLNNDKNLLKEFVIEYGKNIDSEKTYVFREYTLKKEKGEENLGRIDIYIKDDKSAIIIENKIKSDINGKQYIKEIDDEIDQLNKYKKIAEKENIKNLKCYLLVPEYHNIMNDKNDKEIEQKNKILNDKKYEIITYKNLFDFFNSYKEKMGSNMVLDCKLYDEFLKALAFHKEKYQNRAYEIAMRRLKNIIEIL